MEGGRERSGGDLTPEAVIGDLDSLADIAIWRERLGPALVRVEEQESTDLEKCLRLVRAPFFLGVGFVAGRVDHLLAALHALIAEPRPIALIGETDILFSAGETLSLELAPGDRVSFFPLRPVRATGGAGLTWPIEGLELEAGSQIGVSNRAAAAQVEARFDRPGVVVAAPRARLSSVVQCLV